MVRLGSFASYDTMYVVRNVMPASGGITLPEIHVFAYLACLLAVYDGRPASTWGYEFAATESTAPFSSDLLNATELLVSSGLLRTSESVYFATPLGIDEQERWVRLRSFSERTRYLRGATDTSITIPLNAVSEGMLQEPQIVVANSLRSPRPLLDEVGRSALYGQFKALEDALGPEVSDLMVPAVVWITYLLERGVEISATDGSAGDEI